MKSRSKHILIALLVIIAMLSAIPLYLKKGGDAGEQYRTGIYYEDETLLTEIEEAVRKETNKVGQPLAVEVRRLENFSPAEEYHQKYLDKNPGGYCHIPAKLMKMQKEDQKIR